MPLAEGTRLGNCRLVRKLGEGGMAEVWEAVDVSLERHVAIKVVKETISSLPEFDARFRREARTAAQLDHPHVLPIYGFGVEDGVAFIEMPYLSGGTLASRLEDGPPPSPETVCEWVEDLASALDAAHARGIIHRDLKTANVLFDQSGRIVLADFGLAKSMADSSGLTAAGTLMGTPMYLSPEQAKGETLTPRSDQFSLGVLAFRMLAGQFPWGRAAAPAVVMMRIVGEPPTKATSPRPDLPAAVDAVFERVLAKAPERRFESCGAFAAALREALLPGPGSGPVEEPTVVEGQPVLAPQAPVAAPAAVARERRRRSDVVPVPPAPRRTGLVVLLVLFLAVNSVVLGLVVWDRLDLRLPWAAPAGPDAPVSPPEVAPSPTAGAGTEPALVPVGEEVPPVVEGEGAPTGTREDWPSPEPTPWPTPETTPTATPEPTPLPSPTPPPSLPPGAIPPVMTSELRPDYPEELMRRNAGLDGRVELEVLVGEDGRVGAVRVTRGVSPDVDEVVADAARRQLAYSPATFRGKPFEARTKVVVLVRFLVSEPPR